MPAPYGDAAGAIGVAVGVECAFTDELRPAGDTVHLPDRYDGIVVPRWPFFVGEGDIDAARELVGSTERAELFVYPGKEHLFADSSPASYDQAAAELLTSRTLDFLDAVR